MSFPGRSTALVAALHVLVDKSLLAVESYFLAAESRLILELDASLDEFRR